MAELPLTLSVGGPRALRCQWKASSLCGQAYYPGYLRCRARDFQLNLSGAVTQQELQMKRLQLLEAYERQRLAVRCPPAHLLVAICIVLLCWGIGGALYERQRLTVIDDERRVLHGLPRCIDCPGVSLQCARFSLPLPLLNRAICASMLQELRAEEDRIYAQWMAQAQEAAQAARAAYHARRRAQLLEVGCCLLFAASERSWCSLVHTCPCIACEPTAALP